jgi:hypothetical protein
MPVPFNGLAADAPGAATASAASAPAAPVAARRPRGRRSWRDRDLSLINVVSGAYEVS